MSTTTPTLADQLVDLLSRASDADLREVRSQLSDRLQILHRLRESLRLSDLGDWAIYRTKRLPFARWLMSQGGTSTLGKAIRQCHVTLGGLRGVLACDWFLLQRDVITLTPIGRRAIESTAGGTSP